MVFPLPKPTRFRARSLFVLLLLPVLCSPSHAFTDAYGKLLPGFRSFLFGVAGGGAMYFYLKATKEQEGKRGTLVSSDVDKSWSNSKIKLMSVTAGVTTWALAYAILAPKTDGWFKHRASHRRTALVNFGTDKGLPATPRMESGSRFDRRHAGDAEYHPRIGFPTLTLRRNYWHLLLARWSF